MTVLSHGDLVPEQQSMETPLTVNSIGHGAVAGISSVEAGEAVTHPTVHAAATATLANQTKRYLTLRLMSSMLGLRNPG